MPLPLPPMPEDLKQRVLEAHRNLDVLEQRIDELEAGYKRVAVDIGNVRHDYNNMRTVINTLMSEVEQRDPVIRKPRDGKR